MAKKRNVLAILESFKQKPESRGYGLRLDLAQIVGAAMEEKGWTQKQLAEAAGMKESFVTRIMHAHQNCTLDSVGRILFALGVGAELRIKSEAVTRS